MYPQPIRRIGIRPTSGNNVRYVTSPSPSLLPTQEAVRGYGENLAAGFITAITPRDFKSKGVNLATAIGGAVLVVLAVYGLIKGWQAK